MHKICMLEGNQMEWYRIRIRTEKMLRGKTEQLVGEIQTLFRLLDPDPERAVYSSRVNDQVVDVYFTPAAADVCMKIIHRYWGAPSLPPPPTAQLIFGSPGSPNPLGPT
jgi:hypothetical protein